MSSDTATSRARLLFSFLGCNQTTDSSALACAKSVSQAQLSSGYQLVDDNISSQGKFETEIFLPTIDNIVFKKPIDDLAKEGAFKKCNIIAGYNSDEASLFTTGIYGILGPNQDNWIAEAQSYNYQKFMTNLQKVYKFFPYFPLLSNSTQLNSMVKQYFTAAELSNPSSVAGPEYVKRLNRMFSDQQYVCMMYDIARVYSTSGQNAYVYKFQYRHPYSDIKDAFVDLLGVATHGDELIMTPFGMLANIPAIPADQRATLDLLTYWSNFVKFDNPNGLATSSLTRWEPFLASNIQFQSGRTIVFRNSGYTIQTGFSDNKCDFWTSYIEPACTNADGACSQFAGEATKLCDATSFNYILNGKPCRDACRMMCGVCVNPIPCVDQWYCSQFTALRNTYCANTGTIYYVDGAPFRTQCPVTCNSCLSRSAARQSGQAKLEMVQVRKGN